MHVGVPHGILAAVGVAGLAMAASAAPPTPNQLSPARVTPAALPHSAFKPNLSVKAVWIGRGTPDGFAPLGRNPKVGETISLVCDVGVALTVPKGWLIAWYVDGQKTCGEGTAVVPDPSCTYPWPVTEGSQAYVDYVPHTVGSHTFTCTVDVGGTVAESNEHDNSKSVSFTAVTGGLPLPPVPLAPPHGARSGPTLRRSTHQ